jgi:hypothetical protein
VFIIFVFIGNDNKDASDTVFERDVVVAATVVTLSIMFVVLVFVRDAVAAAAAAAATVWLIVSIIVCKRIVQYACDSDDASVSYIALIDLLMIRFCSDPLYQGQYICRMTSTSEQIPK